MYIVIVNNISYNRDIDRIVMKEKEVLKMAKRFLLVDSDVLPDVFMKVVKAKELLAAGSVKNLSAAAKEVDVSP